MFLFGYVARQRISGNIIALQMPVSSLVKMIAAACIGHLFP